MMNDRTRAGLRRGDRPLPQKSFDALLLFILVIARIEIDALADNVLPDRLADARHLVEGWWPAWSLNRLEHPQTDPVTMMLWVAAFGLLLIYMLLSLAEQPQQWVFRVKMGLIFGIIGLLVFGKTALLIGLRRQSVPWSYSHDGGVIQTETTIEYFLDGKNPYVEDYVNTPMAQWGINEYRTALYHYPYLPWTFVSAAPFYAGMRAAWGWYDQRIVYLLLFALMLGLVPRLVRGRQKSLLALMLVGLNPVMAEDVIFGVNDPFVWGWIVLALFLAAKSAPQAGRGHPLWASAALGLACATKPTAWFLVPFWLLYLLGDVWGAQAIPPVSRWGVLTKTALRRAWTLPVVALALIGPWLVWNPFAMYDDVWRWSTGQGETGYQIWGWGASNLVLAFGWVQNRFEYWPFIIPQTIIGLPLLVWLLYQQARRNTLGTMLWGYGIFLFAFFFLSRFMQPNYLGFAGSALALAWFTDSSAVADEPPIVTDSP